MVVMVVVRARAQNPGAAVPRVAVLHVPAAAVMVVMVMVVMRNILRIDQLGRAQIVLGLGGP
jgi:hypothetical protein